MVLTFPVPKQKRVHSLPDGAVDEGLAGQGLVQLVLQGVAALYLPSAHNVVHEVALWMDMLHPGNLLKIKQTDFFKQTNFQTDTVHTSYQFI